MGCEVQGGMCMDMVKGKMGRWVDGDESAISERIIDVFRLLDWNTVDYTS